MNKETRNAFLLSLALASGCVALLLSWRVDGSLSRNLFWSLAGVALVAAVMTHFLCVRAWARGGSHTKAADATAASVGSAVVVAFLLLDVPLLVNALLTAGGAGFFLGAGTADLRVGRAPENS